MESKILLLGVLSLIVSLVFIFVGVYFLSSKFLNKLNEAVAVKSDVVYKKNAFIAKGSGYIAISLGAFTLVWGILLLIFPSIMTPLAIVYMTFLLLAVIALVVIMR